MGIKRRKSKSIALSVLESAKKLAANRVEDRTTGELYQLGVIWTGLLDLDQPIPASEVAAMLAAHSLLLGTRLIDSEEHWAAAASFSAIAALCETSESSDEIYDVTKEEETPIGFTPGHTRSRYA